MAFEKSEVQAVKLTARNVLNKSRVRYWALDSEIKTEKTGVRGITPSHQGFYTAEQLSRELNPHTLQILSVLTGAFAGCPDVDGHHLRPHLPHYRDPS